MISYLFHFISIVSLYSFHFYLNILTFTGSCNLKSIQTMQLAVNEKTTKWDDLLKKQESRRTTWCRISGRWKGQRTLWFILIEKIHTPFIFYRSVLYVLGLVSLYFGIFESKFISLVTWIYGHEYTNVSKTHWSETFNELCHCFEICKFCSFTSFHFYMQYSRIVDIHYVFFRILYLSITMKRGIIVVYNYQFLQQKFCFEVM